MGMFDTIKCEVELPDYHGRMNDFQSKDLDRAMDGYTITEEGRLIHHTVKYVDVPEEEKSHEFHLWNTVPAGDVDRNFHGWLNFYTIDETLSEDDQDLIEFNAKFTDGYLVEVENVKTGSIRRYNHA